MNPYKEGDIVVHIKGRSVASYTRGAGWVKDRIWKVFIREGQSKDIVWTEEGHGVEPEFVRLATPQEIEWFLQGHSSITNMPKQFNYEIY